MVYRQSSAFILTWCSPCVGDCVQISPFYEDSNSCTLHCTINTAGQKDSNVYLKYGIPNEINCVQPHIMFLKHLLIIHASNNTQSFSDEIKCSTFLSDFSCFQIHTAQYKEMTQGTFYLQSREQDGDNLHPNLPLAPYGMYSSFSEFSALQSFSDQDRNCPLVYAWLD